MRYRVVAAVGAMVIMGCIVLSCVSPIAPKTEPNINVPYYEDIVIVEPERVIVRAEIQRSKPDPQGMRSAMPCDMYDSNAFNTLDALDCVGEETENEPETGEEVCTETIGEELGMVSSVANETYADNTEAAWNSPCTAPVETAPVAKTEAVQVENTPQEILLNALRSAGVEWWWPYAYAQVMQESHWNPYAVSADGKDHGLLQYRLQFWGEPESIYDVNAQIRKYVGQVAARIAAGLSVEEIISRHFTSDYVTEINWEYVNHVLSWMK